MKAVLTSIAILTATTAAADEFIIGGTTDYDTGGAGIVLEYHFDDVVQNGRFSANWAVAGRADVDGDTWVGGGIAIEHRFNDRLFLEFSFMPGYYQAGETDLGGNLHYRSLIGLGYNLTDTSFVSFTIDHLSNGGAQQRNPGSEAFQLRYGFSF